MGHLRLGTLPQTPRWRQVVELVADGSSADTVAAAAMDAARKGLELASRDEGLRHTVYLLTQITQAARGDFAAELEKAGVGLPAEPGVFDLVASFSDAVDNHLRRSASRTDLGEMAQMAASETLTALCSAETRTLWESTPEDLRKSLRDLSTHSGFARLAHDFFARLTRRFLTYHLSRELSNHVGPGRRFADISQHGEFLEHLDVTCRQAATIIREFAGGWYSKTNHEGGFTPPKVRDFAWAALKKIRDELGRRGGSGVA